MPLCITAGAGLTVAATLVVESFTLAWTHSIEKVRWEEDWRIEGRTLVITEARIRGTGAGMEPPAGAVLKSGVWHYTPALPALPRIELRHSPHVPPYVLCANGSCQPLTAWLPSLADDAVIEITPCLPAAAADVPG